MSLTHPPLRAVAFDLDGTLIDSTDAIVASYQYVFEHFGHARPTRDAVVASIGHPLPMQLAMMGMEDVEAAMGVYKPYYDSIARDHTTLLPGAMESIGAFRERGLKIALATSKRLDAAEMLLEHLEILEHFASCIGPDEVANPKPHPEPILLTATRLAVVPEELVYIGDMHFDVVAARDAGARCIALTTGYDSREDLEALGPEIVLDSLHEAREYLLGQA